MRTFRQQPRGSAIFLAMVMVVGALALLMGVLTMSTQNVTRHEQYSDREKSFLAAQGMLKTVFTDVWEPIRADANYFPPTGFPSQFGAADSPWRPLLADNFGHVYVGRKLGDCYISDVSTRWHTSSQNTPPGSANPIFRFFLSIRVVAQRTPLGQTNSDGTPFHLPGDVPAVVIETYEMNQSSKSPVAQYVELAKNVSCSLCHTSFDNVFNYFNNKAFSALTNPSNTHLPPDGGAQGAADAKAKFGTFGRAKVASLGNFQMRDNTAGPATSPDYMRFYPSDSSVNGTFYSRGEVQNQHGNPMSAIAPEGMAGVNFGSFNTVDTIAGINIAQNVSTGATTESNMNPASVTNGIPAKWQNLYLQYPTDPSKMSDGQVPLDFPFPFADVSGNKLVTDAAVASKLTDNSANKSSGTTTPNITGSIKGGYAIVVPKGGTYSASSLPLPGDPSYSDSAVANSTTPGVVNGNLVLVGTKDNPVNIDQQTIVKGDIIIKGYYTGVGSLWAQGNVYIPSDLQYKNKQLQDTAGNPLFDTNGAPLEDFGKAAGNHNVTDPMTGLPVPTGNENLGGLVAGGTIIIGDYLTASAAESGLVANPNGGMVVSGYGTTRAARLAASLDPSKGPQINPVDGSPALKSDGYTDNQPPDAFDTTQLPSGITNSDGFAGRENGFPLLPTYQRTDPTATYNYWQMDMTNGSKSEGMYTQASANLTTKNFTISQAEIFNRDQWAKTQPSLPGTDGTFSQTNSTYDPAYVPRYYVLNRGDPVNAFIFSKQSSNPTGTAAQQAYAVADVAARKSHGIDGTYWDDADQTFKGSESSKLWDTLTIGGATMDYSAVAGGGAPAPLPLGAGSLIEGKQSHLVYAPIDPTKPMDPVTNPTGNVLIDSTDPTKAQKAAVIPLNPDWVPTDKMWSILLNEEWSRKAHDAASQAVYSGSGDTASMTNRDGTPFRIDGMLYTNNAIFGIQRNRTLAPQANGDYQNAVQTDPATGKAKLDVSGNPIPYTPDPTKPGPWQTLPPTVASPNDYWQVTELQDVWTRTTSNDNYTYLKDVDNYSGTSHVDHYTRNANVDHYTENQFVDNYSRQAYTDHYTENQYTDNYTRTAYTDHYTQNQNTDHYTRTAFTDHYTENQYTDNYTRNAMTDHYTQTQYTDHYTKTTTTDVYRQTPYTQTTRTWHCSKSTSYGEQYNGDVVQVNPPTTFSQPTMCNGAAVSSATYTDVTTTISPTGTVSVVEPATPPAGYTVLVSSTPVTTTSVSAVYTGAAPAVPAGWTKTTTTSTVVTSVSAVYYSAPAPTVPAGFTLASTSTVTQTSTSAVYTGAPPAPPAGWTKTTTTTTTLTSVSATYFGPPAPTVPAGFTLASTSSVTQTSTSAMYTGAAPTPPAGWTVASTSTVTATSVSAVYFGPPAPTAPAGWTFSSTTTATQTSTSSPYTGAPPTPPAGWTKTTTTTTTLTSVSPVYYTPPPYTPAPAGWTFVNTTSVTQTSTSSPYTGAAPTVPTPGWAKTSTTTSTLTSVSPTYYTTPPYTPAPAGWTFVNTTVTTQTSTTAAYLLPPAPAAPTPGYTFVNTTTSTVTSTSSPYVNGTAAPAVPAGYSLTGTTKTTTTTQSAPYYNGVGEPAVPTGYTLTSTTSTTVSQTLPAGTPYPTDPSSGQYVYYKGNAQPAGTAGYVFSVTNTVAPTVTIKLPHPSTKPSPLAVSVPPPPSDAAYAYNTAGTGQAASDFRMYAKEQESSSRGRLLVNGAVMAPDLGLLVTGRKDPTGKYPSNLILNYDNRVVRLLSLPNTTKFPWLVSRIGWTRLDPEKNQ